MLVPLDNLDILAIVDNEVDPMSTPPASIKVVGRLPEIAFGKGKLITEGRGDKPVKEVAMEQLCCGAHGLSLMLVSCPHIYAPLDNFCFHTIDMFFFSIGNDLCMERILDI